MLRRLAFICIGVAAAAPAFALNIPALPAGTCALDETQPAERVVFDTIRSANQGSNEVLAVFADCTELNALRAQKSQGLTHYGSILKQQLPGAIGMSRSDYLQAASQIYALNGALVSQAIAQAQGAASGAMQDTMLSGTGSMQASSSGVLYNGADVLVVGMEQQHSVNDKTVRVASTAGMTLIGDGTVSVNLYAPFSEGHTRARDQLVAYVPSLIVANP